MGRPTILDREDFQDLLIEKGYAATEAGLKKCIKENLKKMTMSQLGRDLGIPKITLLNWIKKLNLKNPNKSGGNNNPNGCWGNQTSRRSNKAQGGYIYK